MKTKMLLFALLTAITVACSEDVNPNQDGLTKNWSLQSSDLSISFDLWKIDTESNYRIKHISILRNGLDLAPSSVTIDGDSYREAIKSIAFSGSGFNLTLNNIEKNGNNASADIVLTQGTTSTPISNQVFTLQ
jgi:opacity protein-like surface antigen